MNRHKGLEWVKVQAKLEANSGKFWSLNEMEETGGEPDVVGHDKKTGEYIFYDCSQKAPKAAEAPVTTGKRWSQGKRINQKTTLLTWLLSWELSFYRKSNTGSCSNWDISMQKHPAG